jgi:hypothetical protein
MSPAQHTPVAAEHAREALEAYGRMMYDAGMDAASDFRDRHREGEAKEKEAAEMLDAFLASQSTPPPESAGQGLSDAEIHRIAEKTFRDYLEDRNDDADVAFARAILAANPTAQPDGGSKA